jgi:hypothetical protein
VCTIRVNSAILAPQEVTESDVAEGPCAGLVAVAEAVGSPSSHPIYLDSSTPEHLDTQTPVTTARAKANGEETQLRRQFKVILDAYPKRAGGDSPRDGYLAFLERVRAGATPAEILEGVRRYAAYCEATDKIGTEYVKQLRTFLGKSRHYLEPWNLPRAAGANSQSRRNAGEENYERGKRALQDIPHMIDKDVFLERMSGARRSLQQTAARADSAQVLRASLEPRADDRRIHGRRELAFRNASFWPSPKEMVELHPPSSRSRARSVAGVRQGAGDWRIHAAGHELAPLPDRGRTGRAGCDRVQCDRRAGSTPQHHDRRPAMGPS